MPVCPTPRCAPALPVKDIDFGRRSSSPAVFVDLGGTLYFTAWERASGRELWWSDGTAAGTVRVVDLVPGLLSSYPSGFTPSGSRVFFAADDTVTGEELWALPLACLSSPRKVGQGRPAALLRARGRR